MKKVLVVLLMAMALAAFAGTASAAVNGSIVPFTTHGSY